MVKTTHHLSVHCPHFQTLWNSGVTDLESAVATSFELYKIPSGAHDLTACLCKAFFSDGSHWLTGQSLFYLGLIPSLHDTFWEPINMHLTPLHHHYLLQRLATTFQVAGIHLMAWIWSTVCQTFSPFSPQCPLTNITLPPHFSHISLSCTSCLTIFHTDWLLYFTLSCHNCIHFHYISILCFSTYFWLTRWL